MAGKLESMTDAQGSFPRPRVSLRELVGLVVAFAVSNTLLMQLLRAGYRPLGTPGFSNFRVVALWNGLLVFYLAFAFVQAWVRAILRWRRPRPSRYRPRWTALGVAEATVVSGTLGYWLFSFIEKAESGRLDPHDWGDLVLPLCVAGAILFVGLRLWKREPGRDGKRAGATRGTPSA
jgi:hypothetical protein